MITSSHKLISFRVHFLLLNLQELLLQGVVGGGEDGGGQHRVPLLLQHVVDLAVLAAEVEQQTLSLLEHGAAIITLNSFLASLKYFSKHCLDIFPNLHRPHLSPSSIRPENCSVSSFMKCLQQCCSSWCSDPSCLSHTCYRYY